MKTRKYPGICFLPDLQIRLQPQAPLLLLVSSLLLGTVGCTGSDDTPAAAEHTQSVVDITARGMSLIAPDEIPSGWTTFRFINETSVIHFAVLERMPEGFGMKDQQEQVAPVFQAGMDFLNNGDSQAAFAKFGELPEWYGQVVFLGGPGFTSPGLISRASVYLEPGVYIVECYVKTNGIFHSVPLSDTMYGMIHEFNVTDEVSGAVEPIADLKITISSARGIETDATPTPGEHTIAVYFEDQKVHGHFLGHDVHVVRLEDDTDMEELVTWMDWTQPAGLETPAPAEFLGGTHEMPTGGTAYFTVNFEPGRYAWISEVPDPEGKKMLRTFLVPGVKESDG